MMMRVVLSVLCVGTTALTVSPVTRVVNLLKDMSAQLQKEAETDAETFDKVKCWCITNEKGKTQAVATATQMIDQLSATIEEATAKRAQLETELEKLGKEVAEKSSALEEAA